MSYQALARKWRPKTFAEVIGQGHVVKALSNALDQKRIHHAYLFTGTRGVGKTTIARIFAKCLNCEQEVDSSPCGVCGSCEEIDAGRFIDLIEVDAASRTKVEDTRELLDNVQYSPTRGRYKVYLIDEVHMLSGHSFNALLKTLEEPPPHVKFLLATTDPQKLPVTVLSRCLQFNLKRLSEGLIAAHLEKLLQAEEIPSERSALHSLARAADGSVRDALSLLDQGIAYSDGNVTGAATDEMLGTVPREYLYVLMRALAGSDAREIMRNLQELTKLSADFSALFEDIIDILHKVALVQAVPDALDSIEFETEIVKELVNSFEPEDIQLFYQIALTGKRDAYLSTSPQTSLEMTLLRMLAFKPVDGSQAGNKLKSSVTASRPTACESTTTTNDPSVKKEAAALNELVTNEETWSTLIGHLGLQGAACSLAANCSVSSLEDDLLVLQFAHRHEGIATDTAKQRLETALQQHFGKKFKVKFEASDNELVTPARKEDDVKKKNLRRAEKNAHNDEAIRALKAQFDAKIIEGSTRPLNEH